MDLDGVVRDLVGAIDRLYREQFPTEEPVVVPVYDLDLRYPRWGMDTYDIVFRQEVARLFNHDALPYPEAVETCHYLDGQFDVRFVILSKQADMRIPATVDWLMRHGLDELDREFVDGASKAEWIRTAMSEGEIGEDDIIIVYDDSPDEIEEISMMLVSDNVIPVLVVQPWNETYRKGSPHISVADGLTQRDALWPLHLARTMVRAQQGIQEGDDHDLESEL